MKNVIWLYEEAVRQSEEELRQDIEWKDNCSPQCFKARMKSDKLNLRIAKQVLGYAKRLEKVLE